jgi:hypothetical protein
MISTRVAVFIDWQNAYHSARRAFGFESMPNEHGTFSPYRIASHVDHGHDRGSAAKLVKVEVHRGLPSAERDSTGYAANRRQAAAWQRESPLVRARMRPLRYLGSGPDAKVQEKGIDVQLALGIVECLVAKACDVAILISNDTDLIPAIESAARLSGYESIETAAWYADRGTPRLRPKVEGLFHHHLDRTVFDAAEDLTNYARKPGN